MVPGCCLEQLGSGPLASASSPATGLSSRPSPSSLVSVVHGLSYPLSLAPLSHLRKNTFTSGLIQWFCFPKVYMGPLSTARGHDFAGWRLAFFLIDKGDQPPQELDFCPAGVIFFPVRTQLRCPAFPNQPPALSGGVTSY